MDQRGAPESYIGMRRTNEFYRAQAKECCRMAVIVEDVDRRVHWLDAAARWFSFGREQDALGAPDGDALGARDGRVKGGLATRLRH
jgi:hypothetical protein